MAAVTNRQLMEAMREARTEFSTGLKGVHDRLDALNGRTRQQEEITARHDERFRSLSCIRHDERLTAMERQPVKSAAEDTGGGLLKGDWKMLTAIGALAAGAISGLVHGLFKVYQLLGGTK